MPVTISPPQSSPPSFPSDTESPTETLWVSVVFLVTLHIVGVGALVGYALTQPPSFAALGIGALGFVLTSFGISAGYHRLLSHRSFTTGPVLKGLLLLIGASAFQNSALEWARNHRSHHQHTDTDRDPYNARRGFWYSHIGWVVRQGPPDTCDTSDLEADRLIQLQHRYYLPLAVFTGFVAPTLVGWYFGDALGGLLFGGVWRLLLAYHATFSINSFAHWLGRQPYSSKHTARDNWFTAVITMGEGYHNFHHTFPGDYRNGVRFFDFDPPKWVISVLAKWGWVKDVRRTPGNVIALRRLKQARLHLESNAKLPASERLLMVAQADKLKLLLSQWSKASAERNHPQHTKPLPTRHARRAFWKAFRTWEAQVMVS